MIEIDLRAGQLIAHTRAEEHNSGKLIARQQEEVLLAVEDAKHTELEWRTLSTASSQELSQ